MRKLLLLALLALFVSATTTPIVSKVMGFGPGTAFAQDDDAQDDEDDNTQ